MRKQDAWLNVVFAFVVGINAVLATLYWVEGNQVIAIIWAVAGLAWLISVWYRTSIAYHGANDTWDKVDKIRSGF